MNGNIIATVFDRHKPFEFQGSFEKKWSKNVKQRDSACLHQLL